jgi:cysteinyl-tRNA synthetase
MHEDADALGVQRPDHEPRATDFVPEMLDLIGQLEQRGLAYQAGDGDVNYAVRKFDGYGKLSGKSLDDLRAGERVEVDSAKQDPLDFVLWKHAKPGEPAWPSPWGEGRPGWHIECSAMSSQPNFFTIREVLKQFDAEVVRFFILRAHYRSALNYSDAHLDDARRSLDGLYFALRDVPPVSVELDWSNDFAARFAAALNEDFDSHGAISVLFELAGEVNRQRNAELSGLLKALGAVIGLLERDPLVYLRGASVAGGLDESAIEQLITERAAAKKARNFAEADRVRDVLKAEGIILDDSPQGTSWRRA